MKTVRQTSPVHAKKLLDAGAQNSLHWMPVGGLHTFCVVGFADGSVWGHRAVLLFGLFCGFLLLTR
jgi:hypothetical protein